MKAGSAHHPHRLWVVRHGESAGNVALRVADEAGHHWIDVAARDADVPLSPVGERQARAVGRWFATQPDGERPTVILTSPYLRAHRTTEIIVERAALGAVPVIVDERLREKEFGVLNRMTKAGIMAKMPDQAELRLLLGKFYYRPPGGESWADILLRLRSVWLELLQEHAEDRVLIVCHSVVTLCFRYLVERLSEQQILAIDATTQVANCAVTSYVARPDAAGRRRLALEAFNFSAPIEDAGEPVTSAKDAPLPK